MRHRAHLFALLSAALAACKGANAAPTPAAAAPSAQVTPVTTLFIAGARPSQPLEQIAPWSLTASDGSGLALTRIDAKAVVEGPLAFTELHLYFHNPEHRTREGTFSITLPQGAAVSRFAMENNGQLMEAEVVEKQLARRAYDDFLHRKQDPALLEKAEGNQFSAKVFPIPAQADKHLVISFSQEVSPGHYALPLRGLATTGRVDVRVQVRGTDGKIAEQTLSQHNWKPDRDVVVDGTTVGSPMAVAAGDLVAARLKVELPSAAEVPASVTLLVDTSASRALGFAGEAKAIHQLVDQLARDYGGALAVQVVAFDQDTQALYDGRADKIGNLEQALTQRGAYGASDLGQALRWLAAHSPRSRVVVISDGVITAGADAAALPALAKQLAGHGVDRIDIALTGGIRDDQAVGALAHAGLAHAGAVLDLDHGADDVARRIGLAVRTDVPIAVDGARWVFPRTIATAQAGDEVTVYARRDANAQPLTATLAGKRTSLTPVAVTPALLGRAVAGAEIRELDGKLATMTGPAADQLRADIVRRSVAARVVSSQTSLLVLESDADYARYGIDRRGLAEILAIGPTGVELLHRVAPPQIAAPVPVPAPRKEIADSPGDAHMRKAAKRQFVADKDDDDDDDDGKAAPAKPVRRSAEHRSERQAGKRIEVDAVRMRADDDDGAEAGGDADVRRDRVEAPAHNARAHAVAESRLATSGIAAASPPPPPAAAMPARAPEPTIAVDAGMYYGTRSLTFNGAGAGSDNSGNGASANDDGLAAHREIAALTGPLAQVERLVKAGNAGAALRQATSWHNQAPGDVLALIGMGDALEASHNYDFAARVYGSIIDLFPARADFRRFAGERLERLGKQRALVIDTYQRAVADRPDHLTGHRLLAFALVRDGQYAAAFAAILAGIDRDYPDGRFAGAERVLAEDASMIGAAYAIHVPGKRSEVEAQLTKRGLKPATQPSTRFIMYWETDDNDVDFHIRDGHGGHAWYANKQLRSGGELYADITTGYGPECFAIPGTPKAGPYQLSINYYSQGPMGYGMGLLQIEKFDGQGNLSFEDRPYVIMVDQAFVDLGTYR